MDIFIQQIINGLVLGSMYALVALGYTMVYGVLNLINFAHGDVLMVGAMAGLTILKMLNTVAPDLPGIVKLIIAILGAIPVCVAVNVLIERVAYRRLRNAPRLAPLITAIGVSILLQTLAMMIWGRSPIPFPQEMPTEPLHIMGALISPTQVMLLILAAVAMGLLVLLIEKTKMGRAMRATSENHRRGDVGRQLFIGAVRDGLCAWPESILRCGTGRHRQYLWCDAGWHPARLD
jgi:branched-chain amino acid transport system permease protein